MNAEILEYVVNKFITLKLEYNFTYIYIKEKRFMHCIRLVIDIPKYETENYDKIDSIDEAAELNKTLFQNMILEGYDSHDITHEEEFWGHCSNLQAWVENNYDTRLLHSNISFPLLKALVEAGDPKAKEVFKEEIALRFSSGYLPVIAYLINEDYLEFLNDEEREILISDLIKTLDRIESGINHRDVRILNDIGHALNNLELYDYAIRFLDKALEIQSNYSYALNNLGLSYFHKGNYNRAKYYYEHTIEADPNYSIGWSNLSEIYDIEGNYEKAIELAQKSLELNSNNYEALFFLGNGFYRTGNLYEAIENLKKSLSVDDLSKKPFSLKDFRIYFVLSNIYFEMEDFKGALDYCNKSIELNQTFEDAKRFRKKILREIKNDFI